MVMKNMLHGLMSLMLFFSLFDGNMNLKKGGLPNMNLFAESLRFAIGKSSSRRPKSPGKVSHRKMRCPSFLGFDHPIKTEQLWKDE